jgi:chromosome segregation ATPase
MEDTDKGLTTAQRDIDNAVSSLNALQGKSGPDLRQQYIAFNRRVNSLEAQQRKLQSRQDSLQQTARSYFRSWEDDLKRFSNSELKKKSRQRMMNTMDSYNKIFDALAVQDDAYRTILNDMRDLRRYLGYDLTQDSVNSLSDNIKKVNQDAQSVRDKMREASRELEGTSTPVPSEVSRPQGNKSQGPAEIMPPDPVAAMPLNATSP